MEKKTVREIVGKQYLPEGEEADVLWSLTDNKMEARWNIALAYVYGIIRGKQIERSRRKGGAV